MAGDPYPKPAPRARRKRRRLPFVSAKRAAERETRNAIRDVVIARDRTCRAGPVMRAASWPLRPPVACNVTIDDVHEVKTRARGGDYLDAANCIGVCRPCHRWITEHPAEAHRLGLVRHSWEN